MKQTTIIGVVVVVLIAGGAWWYVGQQPSSSVPAAVDTATPVQTSADTSQVQVQTSVNTTPAPVTLVVYGDEGFSPKTVTIPPGTRVEFVDRSVLKDMWVASAAHPTHQMYDGTTKVQHCVTGYTGAKPFDQCSIGTSFDYTFDKVGTWKYHNHVEAGDFGTVIVQ